MSASYRLIYSVEIYEETKVEMGWNCMWILSSFGKYDNFTVWLRNYVNSYLLALGHCWLIYDSDHFKKLIFEFLLSAMAIILQILYDNSNYDFQLSTVTMNFNLQHKIIIHLYKQQNTSITSQFQLVLYLCKLNLDWFWY